MWQPIADLLRQQQTGGMQGYRKTIEPTPDLSDLLARHAQAMSERAQYDEKLATALKSLEVILSPEQKQTLKIAFFTSMQHWQHHQKEFGQSHGQFEPQAPDGTPSDNTSQPG